MFSIVPLTKKSEWEWVSEKAGCSKCDDTKGVVAYRGRKIAAVVALDSWSYNSVTIHIAVDDILAFKHGFPEEVFNYVFKEANKGVVIGITPADNVKALKFNAHIGLEELYRIRDGYAIGVDYVVQQLRKENCRYIDHDETSAKSVAA
mgnify:CR=1 FL=1|jgi:hypothetical protein